MNQPFDKKKKKLINKKEKNYSIKKKKVIDYKQLQANKYEHIQIFFIFYNLNLFILIGG